MFRYGASLFLGLALMLSMAAPAKASAISICTAGTSVSCTFDFNGSTSGDVDPSAALGGSPYWLVGYSLLLNQGFAGTYAGGTANVFALVVLHSNKASFFQAADPGFGAAFAAAAALDPIDLTPLSSGQIVGTPTGNGSLQYNGLGLVNNIGGNWQLPGIAWVDPTGAGGSTDSITVLGAQTPATVPEPATFTLFGLGAAVGGYRRWRTRRNAA